VADVGAETGYYSMRVAEKVGAKGVSRRHFRHHPENSEDRSKAFDLQNVELVLGTADDPKLAPDSLPASLILDSYIFTNHTAMLEKDTVRVEAGRPPGHCRL